MRYRHPRESAILHANASAAYKTATRAAAASTSAAIATEEIAQPVAKTAIGLSAGRIVPWPITRAITFVTGRLHLAAMLVHIILRLGFIIKVGNAIPIHVKTAITLGFRRRNELAAEG